MLDRKLLAGAFPDFKDTSYLNTSSTGLISNSSIECAQKFNEELYHQGSKSAERFLTSELPTIRATASEFTDAPKDEIAFIPNFSYGLCAIIPAFTKLKKVLLFKDDYPSLTIPFQINDFEIFWVECKDGFSIDIDELKQSILEHKIEILALSHVQYLTGFTVDIQELGKFCKEHNVLFIVDGTQSLGALPFSFKNSSVDVYITSNYKWMNGGFGTGIMCIKSEVIERYTPKTGGFNSYKSINGQWKYIPSISSYEPGHLNMAGLSLLKDAMEFKLKIGIKNIADHNFNLMDRLVKGIKHLSIKLVGPDTNQNRSNIIGIHGDEKLANYLSEMGIITKMRSDIIRIGIHFYNTEIDIDRLIKALKSY